MNAIKTWEERIIACGRASGGHGGGEPCGFSNIFCSECRNKAKDAEIEEYRALAARATPAQPVRVKPYQQRAIEAGVPVLTKEILFDYAIAEITDLRAICKHDAAEQEDIAKRLRRVAKAAVVPVDGDDSFVYGAAFVLLGQIAYALESRPSPSSVGAAIRALEVGTSGSKGYVKAFCHGAAVMRDAAAALAEQVQGQQLLYEQLLMAIARKYPGESRHETALKYIQRAESENSFVPEGWKLVPLEPTDEMRVACLYGSDADEIDADWKAMLAAAPSIAQDGQKSEADHA